MNRIEEQWLVNYEDVPETLRSLKSIDTILSVFNVNIDAVKKVAPRFFQTLLDKIGDPYDAESPKSEIASSKDLLRGFIECFRGGIAQEWLITDQSTYRFLDQHIGYDTLQMGGQGGIIANVMATCGIQNVLVHAASLPQKQSSLFVDRANLLSATNEGVFHKANEIDRKEDIPLIHWILEFNKGDTIRVNDEIITSPRSNRFIATWDPLNFTLSIDGNFLKAVERSGKKLNYCLLSGYQMLTENLENNATSIERILESKKSINAWRLSNKELIVHFEFASTQDVVVRKQLFQEMSGWADSMGLNEQELIDILTVEHQEELAKQCKISLGSVDLFKGLVWVFGKAAIPRIQLHFFGLYITIQKKGYQHSPTQTRRGMTLAATVAGSKAGTGSIENEDNLLWANGQAIGKVPIKELESLAEYIAIEYGDNELLEHGIYEGAQFDIIAVPTIIIENPITLVGMGDTISSLSLVGAR